LAKNKENQLKYDIVQLGLESDNGVPDAKFDGVQYSYEDAAFADIKITEPEGSYPFSVLSEGLNYDFNVEGDDDSAGVSTELEFPNGTIDGVSTYTDQDISVEGGVDFQDSFTPNQINSEAAEAGEYVFHVQSSDSSGLQLVEESQSFTVEEPEFNAIFDLIAPEDEEEFNKTQNESIDIDFEATAEADTDASYEMRINLEEETIIVDTAEGDAGEEVTLEGDKTFDNPGIFAWEVVAEDDEDNVVSSGEQTFTIIDEEIDDVPGIGLISRLFDYVQSIDQSIRASLDEGGQFLFASIMVMGAAIVVHVFSRSDALSIITALLGIFGFSISPGYFPTFVALVMSALAAGIMAWFSVRGASGG